MPNLQLRHLVTLMPALLALGCGGSAPGDSPTPYEVHPRGSWVDSRFDQRAGLMSTEERAALGLLDELGYSAGGATAPRESGVVRWDRERSAAGLNLYCSGHGAEAILMDMSGEVLHRWAHPYEDLPAAPPPAERYQGAWRRLHLFDDGSLLAIHEGLALVKVGQAVGRGHAQLCDADDALIDGNPEPLLEQIPDVGREIARLGSGADQEVNLARVPVNILAHERIDHRRQLAQDGLGARPGSGHTAPGMRKFGGE
jgi:hypothetical protein